MKEYAVKLTNQLVTGLSSITIFELLYQVKQLLLYYHFHYLLHYVQTRKLLLIL